MTILPQLLTGHKLSEEGGDKLSCNARPPDSRDFILSHTLKFEFEFINVFVIVVMSDGFKKYVFFNFQLSIRPVLNLLYLEPDSAF